MKKIILTSFISFCVTLCAFSQDPVAASNKTLTVAEANRLNGVAQPTINGIPYSQYKAQQDALKQKQANENKTLTAQTAVANTHAPAQNVQPATPPSLVSITQDLQKAGSEKPASAAPIVPKTPPESKQGGQ